MKAIVRFHERLESLGIPIDGVSGTGPACRIDFKAAATQAQVNQGNAERTTFDWLDTLDPNYRQFMLDVFNDTNTNIPVTVKERVSQMGLWFWLGEKTIAAEIWAGISALASAPRVRTHATNNNFTLP